MRYGLEDIVAHLVEAPERSAARPQREASPADLLRPSGSFNAIFTEGDVLEWLGFTQGHTDSQGEHWVRPGKSVRDGTSATVYHDEDGSHVTIWSDTVVGQYPALEVRRPYDAFGLWVCTFFGGDFLRASEALVAEGFGEWSSDQQLADEFLAEIEADILADDSEEADEEFVRSSWAPVPKDEVLHGNPEPPPSIFTRVDGVCLLYRGKVNAFLGESESAKSWAGQVAVEEVTSAGGNALIIDFENTVASVRDRLYGLGVTKEVLRAHIDFIVPDTTPGDADAMALAEVLKHPWDLIVVDGITDAMTLLGLDPLGLTDASRFDQRFLRPLARTGAAVVVIDHVTKNAETRGMNAIGSQHKRAALTGAAYMFQKVDDFGRGLKGMSQMFVAKDKMGHVRQYARSDKVIADFYIDGTNPAALEYRITEPSRTSEPVQVYAHIMEALCNYLAVNPGVTQATVLTMGSTAREDYKKAAFDKLRVDGYIAEDMGQRNKWRVVRAFREESFIEEQGRRVAEAAVIADIENEQASRRRDSPVPTGVSFNFERGSRQFDEEDEWRPLG